MDNTTEEKEQKTGPDLTTLHGRLRYARKAAGFRSQDKAAPLLEISKNTLNRYESGDGVPDAVTLTKMLDIYGCTSAWLLLGRGPMPGTQELEPCPLCGSSAEKLTETTVRCESASCCMHKSTYPVTEWQNRLATAA